MTVMSLVTPRTGKIIKMVCVFGRGENLLQNGMLHLVFKLIVRNRITNRVTKLEFTQTKNRHF